MDHPKKRAVVVSLLPDDALVEILSRVPAKSLCRFKCVSKAWHDLITDRLRCKKLPQTLEGFFYTYDVDDNKIHGRDSGGDGGGKEDSGSVSSDCIIFGHFINTLGKFVPLASYSFLLEQPGVESIGLMGSCNGLLLFAHRRDSDNYDSLGYIVCNPATEHWVAVPTSGWEPFPPSDDDENYEAETGYNSPPCTYLIFDPAVSSQFQLVQFWAYNNVVVDEVHTYSSETGVWSERTSEWSLNENMSLLGSTFLNGMLHFSVTRFDIDRELIVAVDGEGKRCRVISGPHKCCDVVFVGQSQGRLHYMTKHRDTTRKMTELSIWVLHDYDAEEWVLKHSVTYFKLFGRMSCQVGYSYSVVDIHPDRNLIYFVQHWDRQLKSYDMDSKEVCTLRTIGVCPQRILPYVPYFAESSALASKH
jgi:hypothetical protein